MLAFWPSLFELAAHLFACSPAYATPKLLDKLGLQLSDIDVFEYHEAFAVSKAHKQTHIHNIIHSNLLWLVLAFF